MHALEAGLHRRPGLLLRGLRDLPPQRLAFVSDRGRPARVAVAAGPLHLGGLAGDGPGEGRRGVDPPGVLRDRRVVAFQETAALDQLEANVAPWFSQVQVPWKLVAARERSGSVWT